MKNLELIKKLCHECIEEGEHILSTKWSKNYLGGLRIANPTNYVDLESFQKWKSNCNVLINLLGDLASPWAEAIEGNQANTLVNAKGILGALRSMSETIENGYLIKIEDLVFAEAFANLIEQSEYLFNQDYILAAGVIARAVLEEKIRNLCSQQNISFSKLHPTLSDYNQELYKLKLYSKIEFKKIDFLISIGNSAAHNNEFTKGEIMKLIEGVKSLLEKYN